MHLPLEIIQKVIEHCDYSSRCNLSSTSFTMNRLVKSTKLYIPYIKIEEWINGGFLMRLVFEGKGEIYVLKFKAISSNSTRIRVYKNEKFHIEVSVENSNPIDEFVSLFKRICLQKNAVIGILHVIATRKSEVFYSYFSEAFESLQNSLNVKSILWNGMSKPELLPTIFKTCNKKVLNEFKVIGGSPRGGFDLLGTQPDTMRNIEKIEVMCDSIATDDVVLSLNASVISLKSQFFSRNLIRFLIEKFVNEKTVGSSFHIEKTRGFINFVDIPRGFEEVEHSSWRKYQKIYPGSKKVVVLLMSDDWVKLEIGESENYEFFPHLGKLLIEPMEQWDSDSSGYENYDDSDDDYYDNSSYYGDDAFEGRYFSDIEEEEYLDLEYNEDDEFL